jgi:hypothetical protein
MKNSVENDLVDSIINFHKAITLHVKRKKGLGIKA